MKPRYRCCYGSHVNGGHNWIMREEDWALFKFYGWPVLLRLTGDCQ